MFKALSFQKKIILSQFILFLLFNLILFPFIEEAANRIVYSSLEEDTSDLTKLVKKTSYHEELGEFFVVPLEKIQDLVKNFKISFLLSSFISLLFFTALAWIVFIRLSHPIRQILHAIKPYQAHSQELIPEIILDKSLDERDDFSYLAKTLNSLSKKIRMHIQYLTEERDEKEAILESLGEGVVAVDANMNIRYVNFTATKMLGISQKELLNHSFSSFLGSSLLLDKCKEMLQKCQAHSATLTDSLILQEGKKIYFDLIAAPKQRNGAIIVIQDKTSHYKILEIGKDFVANASHELRTPITIIKGFAETLQDISSLSPQMLSDSAEKIIRNCTRMENLVKNLLTLAEIENLPGSRFQSCDLISLIENCRHLTLGAHPEARIVIKKNENSLFCSADPDLLELAIMNLFENGIKYSPSAAELFVHLEKKEGHIRLAITDRGIGIPEHDLEHIFERFYTVNKAHSRKLGGAGLGLSIVKTVIQKHEGSIKVASHLGKGSTFTLALPTKI